MGQQGQYSLSDVQSAPQTSSAGQYGMSDVQTVHPQDDTGVFASLKRTGSNLLHLPGAVYDAFTKPPQNDSEKRYLQLGGPTELAIQRLIVNPSASEFGKAIQAHAQAQKGKPDFGQPGNTGHPLLDNTLGRFIDFGDKGTGSGDPNAEHMANMHAIGTLPGVGPMAADITQRYLSGDKSGAITDLASNVAGPKLAEGAINGVTRALANVAPDVAERMYSSALKPSTTIPAAERAQIVRTGLDNSIPVSPKGAEKLSGLIADYNTKVKEMIQGGADNGATINPEAVAARADQVKSRFMNQVNPESDLAAIDASKEEFLRRFGGIDESGKFAYRARDVGEVGIPSDSHSQATLSHGEANGYLESRGNIQGKPQQLVRVDLSKLNSGDYQLMPGPNGTKWVKFTKPVPESIIEPLPKGIPVDQAQAIKQGTYQQLKGRAYGELRSGTIEAQKALARGIKEELETQFPEIKGLNAQEAKFINLDGVLERALNRIGNHQLIGIGTPIAAGAAGAVVGHPGAAALAAGGLKAILDNPVFKSRLAIAISKGGKIPPSIANVRVNQFFNALAQSQSAAGVSAPATSQ